MHWLLEFAPVVGVEKPLVHGWQSGTGSSAVPPGEK